MNTKENSKQSEEIIIDKSESQKIECYEIPVKIPKEIEPGSKLEFRYLNYLIKKYSNDDCDTSMNLEE